MTIKDIMGGRLLACDGDQGNASMRHELVAQCNSALRFVCAPRGLVCNARPQSARYDRSRVGLSTAGPVVGREENAVAYMIAAKA